MTSILNICDKNTLRALCRSMRAHDLLTLAASCSLFRALLDSDAAHDDAASPWWGVAKRLHLLHETGPLWKRVARDRACLPLVKRFCCAIERHAEFCARVLCASPSAAALVRGLHDASHRFFFHEAAASNVAWLRRDALRVELPLGASIFRKLEMKSTRNRGYVYPATLLHPACSKNAWMGRGASSLLRRPCDCCTRAFDDAREYVISPRFLTLAFKETIQVLFFRDDSGVCLSQAEIAAFAPDNVSRSYNWSILGACFAREYPYYYHHVGRKPTRFVRTPPKSGSVGDYAHVFELRAAYPCHYTSRELRRHYGVSFSCIPHNVRFIFKLEKIETHDAGTRIVNVVGTNGAGGDPCMRFESAGLHGVARMFSALGGKHNRALGAFKLRVKSALFLLFTGGRCIIVGVKSVRDAQEAYECFRCHLLLSRIATTPPHALPLQPPPQMVVRKIVAVGYIEDVTRSGSDDKCFEKMLNIDVLLRLQNLELNEDTPFVVKGHLEEIPAVILSCVFAEQLAHRHVLNNAAVIVYRWGKFTLSNLLNEADVPLLDERARQILAQYVTWSRPRVLAF